MLVMVVFVIAFRWIHLSTPLIRLFLLVLILLLMPTLNFLPFWFALTPPRFYPLSLHDALPILRTSQCSASSWADVAHGASPLRIGSSQDRKSTRLNSSHGYNSYAVFCLKKKTFRWIHLSTPLIRLFLLVLILLLMPTLIFLPAWFALSLLRFRLPSRLPMVFILWMVAMMVVIIPSRTV